MAVYEFTGTKSDTYAKGEKVRTVNGSIHDQRLADSKNWKPVDEAAKDATEQAKAEG